MIGLIAKSIYRLQGKSRRLIAAGRNEECTWINHALITVILGGGVGAAVGRIFGIALLGFKIGLGVALAAYAYREIAQWRNRPAKPAGWLWDACLDVAFPAWLCSYPLGGPIAFAVLTVVVAGFHWFLRPIE